MMPEEFNGNGNGRRPGYVNGLLAPTFLAGVILTVGGFIWFDAGQAAAIKSNTDSIVQERLDIDRLRQDAQLNRDKDILSLNNQLDSIRHDINQWRQSEEDKRGQDQSQYLTLNNTLQRLDSQMTYALTPKLDGRR